jgi:hypothetical protein
VNRRVLGAAAAGESRWPRAAAVVILAIVAVAAIVIAAAVLSGDDSPEGPAPQTLKKGAWGVIEHEGESLFPKYRDLGVGIFTIQARWDQIAPRRPRRATDRRDPAYVWPTYLDETIAEARKYGIEIAIQIISTPKWASGGRAWNWPPRDPADFGDFAAAMSKRYPQVRHWMIWGEPNGKRAFGPVVDAPATATTRLNRAQARAPQLYAQMLDAAYEALKGVKRENFVIGGNTFQGAGHPVIRPYQWLRYLRLPNGSRPRMDLWGHNPYSYRKPFFGNPPSPGGRVDFSDLERFAAALDKAFRGSPPLKLYLSEWGIPTEEDADFQFHVDDDVAVNWVEAAFRIVREWDRIYTLGWSVPVDTERNPQGLMNEDLSPKPVYDAFKEG